MITAGNLYSLVTRSQARQAIATRIDAVPTQSTVGLFYFVMDHLSVLLRTSLGSARLLATPNSNPIQRARLITYHFGRLSGNYRGSALTTQLTLVVTNPPYLT